MTGIFKTFKKAGILFLAALLVLPLMLVGCSKDQKPVKQKISHVYKSELVTLPDQIQYFNNMFYVNDTLYFLSGVRGDDGSYKTVLYRLNDDFAGVTQLMEIKNEDGSYMTTMTMLPDGTVRAVFDQSSYDETTQEYKENFTLVSYGADGVRQNSVSLTDQFKDLENFYIYNLMSDSAGNLYMTGGGNSVCILNGDGTKKKIINIENVSVNNIIIDSSDNIYVNCYDSTSSKNVIKKLDPETGSVSDMQMSDISNYTYGIITAAKNSGYDFYYNNSVSICGYSAAKSQSVELCNWINSDINANQIGNIIVIDENKIICTFYNDTDGKQKLAILTSVPEEEITEKYILTIAAVYIDYYIRSAVINFNRSSDEYRIELRDYSVYMTDGDYDAAVTKLNNDIIAGNIPDIIQLNSNIPVDSYISKGLFADLNPFIEADDTLSRSDYLTNIFDAFSVNGHLYELVPSFSINTLAGKASVLGNITGWTMDEFNAALAKYPDSKPFFDMTRENYLNSVLTITANQYINKDTGECNFNSDNFIKLLDFIKTLKEKSIWDEYNWQEATNDPWSEAQLDLREGRILLEAENINSFRGYWQLVKGTFGDEVVFPGYPNENRVGAAISPTIELAMSSKTKSPEGAWQFLKYFLSDEYQDTIDWNFPVKLKQINDLATESMKPYSYTDPQTGETTTYPTTWWNGKESIEIGEITQEYVDKLMDFLKSQTQVTRFDNSMMDIIKEETSAFFSGAKTAEEAASLIQNRVSIYLSESR